jgi:cell division protein FtsW
MLYTARAPRPTAELDFSLLWLVFGLLLFGLTMVYSASLATAALDKGVGYNGQFYALRQGIYIALGVALGAALFQLPTRLLQQLAPWLFLGGVFLLIVVLIPGLGREENGARRWIPLGFGNLQPAELMKLAAILYAADYTTRKAAFMDDFKKGFLPMAAVMLGTGTLLLMQPDFGSFVVVVTLVGAILFLGGLNWRVFAGLIAVLIVGFAALIVFSPYRMARLTSFLDPFADPYGKGYQLSHALYAFGRGEWFGAGLGGGIEKLGYLPEAHTDFLVSVIAEEFGFIGVAAVIVVFAVIVVKALLIARQAARLDRHFCALVAAGVGVWIGVQAFINLGVNTALLPTKGLTLPFMSYGGSGLIANCLGIALLLRIDWEHRQMMRGKTF